MELLAGIGLDTLSKAQSILKPEWPEFDSDVSGKDKILEQRVLKFLR